MNSIENKIKKLISVPEIILRLQYEEMRFMQLKGVPRDKMDCRIYIDMSSYDELRQSLFGELTHSAYEMATQDSIRGFKIYRVYTADRLLDVVVREKDY